MTLQEAIDTLISGSELSRPWLLKGYEDALKLGIEALKRMQLWRQCGDPIDLTTMPGETE